MNTINFFNDIQFLYGVGGINGTLLGLGERTGNALIEALLIEYMGLTGGDSVDTTVITEMAKNRTSWLSRVPIVFPIVLGFTIG